MVCWKNWAAWTEFVQSIWNETMGVEPVLTLVVNQGEKNLLDIIENMIYYGYASTHRSWKNSDFGEEIHG